MTLTRPRVALLLAGGTIAVWAFLTAFLSHVAHAGVEATAPAAAGWSLGEIMIILGLVGVVFGGLAALLHSIAALVKAVASRTATTVDDGVGDVIEGMADKLDQIAAHFPDPPRTPGPVEPHVAQSGFVRIGLLATLALAGALALGATSCGGTGPVATAGHAVLDCTKQDAKSLEAELLDVAVAAVRYALELGQPDWKRLGTDALNSGTVIATCAYSEYKAASKPKVQGLVTAREVPDEALAAMMAKLGVTGIVTSKGVL